MMLSSRRCFSWQSVHEICRLQDVPASCASSYPQRHSSFNSVRPTKPFAIVFLIKFAHLKVVEDSSRVFPVRPISSWDLTEELVRNWTVVEGKGAGGAKELCAFPMDLWRDDTVRRPMPMVVSPGLTSTSLSQVVIFEAALNSTLPAPALRPTERIYLTGDRFEMSFANL